MLTSRQQLFLCTAPVGTVPFKVYRGSWRLSFLFQAEKQTIPTAKALPLQPNTAYTGQ